MTNQRKFTKCPVCGVSVSTNNLAEHLQRVHSKTSDGGVVRERAETNPLKADTGNGHIVDITACVMALDKGTRLIFIYSKESLRRQRSTLRNRLI